MLDLCNSVISYKINTQDLINEQYIKINVGPKELITFSVELSGLYLFHISCNFNEVGFVGLYINDIEDTVYPIENGNLLIHQVIHLLSEDTISLKYLLDQPNKIINFENQIKIWKIF